MSEEFSQDEHMIYAMVKTANALGHALPWATLLDIWPYDKDRLTTAVAVLQMVEWIVATKDGFKTLGES